MRRFTVNIVGAGTDYNPNSNVQHIIPFSPLGHMWFEFDDGQTRGFAFAEERVIDYDHQTYADTEYSKEYWVSETQYQRLIDYANNPDDYGFELAWNESNNCVDYIWKGLEQIGLNDSKFEGDRLPMNNRDNLEVLPDTFSNDYDEDGITNTIDNDIDGDGTNNSEDSSPFGPDADNDGNPDQFDDDDDGDLIPDTVDDFMDPDLGGGGETGGGATGGGTTGGGTTGGGTTGGGTTGGGTTGGGTT
ncbi:MAG: hypothetical protein WC799_24070, partial [Desulfobacteraceae bacterium]